MRVFVFQAALWCETCAQIYMREHSKPSFVDMGDESTYDSREWPKGPYGDGGGEADSPQHCYACGEFLENPLTPDGRKFVHEYVAPYVAPDDGDSPDWRMVADRASDDGEKIVAEWVRFYCEEVI